VRVLGCDDAASVRLNGKPVRRASDARASKHRAWHITDNGDLVVMTGPVRPHAELRMDIS
jgi:hypothetical protein